MYETVFDLLFVVSVSGKMFVTKVYKGHAPRSPFNRDCLITDMEVTVGTYKLRSYGGE